MQDAAILPLADDFPPEGEAAWRALVDKTLKGDSFDRRLLRRTADGLMVQPLYPPAEARTAGASRAPGDPLRPWDLRTAVRHPDPASANAAVLQDLENGAASVLLRVGEGGLPLTGLEQALQGVLLDLAPVALDAGLHGPVAADAVAALAKAAPAAPLAFHLDPLTVFAQAGGTPGPVESHIVSAATTAVRHAQAFPAASLFLASGRAVHEAGGGDAQELALMAAAAVCYARALARAGLPAAEAFGRIVFGVSVDGEYLTGVAKVRAARAIAARLALAAGGDPAAVRIEARSSHRMLTRRDPWVNLLRLTQAGFAAACGGADAIVLAPFTDALGLPDAFARRQARNTQLVLMEEAQLGRVADPAAGAGWMENVTDALARDGWRRFQAIEAAGGVIAALTDGAVQREVAEVAAARRKALNSRKDGLIGVSLFPNLDEDPVAVEAAAPAPAAAEVRHPGPDGRCEPLAPWRLAEVFEALRDAGESGAPPRAVLATLGGPADYTARVTFTQGLLGAGGVRSEAQDAEAVTGGGLVVLCSSDALYAERAEAAVRGLKARGAGAVWLAGKPGELEGALTAAGVDGYLFAGMDVAATLAQLQPLARAGAPA